MAKPKTAAAAPAESTSLVKPGTALAGMFADTAQGDDQDSRGNEDVTSNDMLIPRIELLQDLSPAIDEDDEKYIDGAEAGQMYNTLTSEIYGDSVVIVPIFYAYVYNLWIDRKKGGGFRGSYPTEAAAKAEIPRLAQEEEMREADFQVIETAINYVYALTEDGRIEEASLAFAKTKLSASRKLNSLIRMAGGSRWRRAYHLKSMKKKNNKGTFYTFDVAPAGFISADLYKRAEEAYDLFSKGFKEGRLNTNFDMEPDDAAPSAGNGDSEI